MSRFNAGRYIIAETAVSVAVNAVLNVVPAALSANGGAGATALGASGLAPDAVLPLFMGAFMSALVPSLLTRWRQLGGKLRTPPGRGGPTVVQVMSASLFVAASFTALGVLLAGTVPPLVAGKSPTLGVMLLLKGAYGGLLAAFVTPSALLLLFGRGWGKNHGQDKRAGDRPGTVADRLFGGGLQCPSRPQRRGGPGRAGTR